MRIYVFLILLSVYLVGCHDTGIEPDQMLNEQYGGTYSGNQITKTRHYNPTTQSTYDVLDTAFISRDIEIRYCADSTKFKFDYGSAANCCYN